MNFDTVKTYENYKVVNVLLFRYSLDRCNLDNTFLMWLSQPHTLNDKIFTGNIVLLISSQSEYYPHFEIRSLGLG